MLFALLRFWCPEYVQIYVSHVLGWLAFIPRIRVYRVCPCLPCKKRFPRWFLLEHDLQYQIRELVVFHWWCSRMFQIYICWSLGAKFARIFRRKRHGFPKNWRRIKCARGSSGSTTWKRSSSDEEKNGHGNNTVENTSLTPSTKTDLKLFKTIVNKQKYAKVRWTANWDTLKE